MVQIHREEIPPSTRVLALPHIDNVLGLRHPLPELVSMARASRAASVWVDGTPGLVRRSPGSWEMGTILVVGLERVGATEASDTLYREHGIVVGPFPQEGVNSLRVPPNLFHTEEEMNSLPEILEEMG